LDELQEVKPSLYRELNLLKEILERGGGSDRPLRQAQDNLQRPWHFARYSLLLMAFSVVPFVGPVVAFFGQILLVTNRLGWNLLSVYTQDCLQMKYSQQKAWMRSNRWLIFGFTLPFALVTSVPFVGPLLTGLAEGASAHLVVHITEQDPLHREWFLHQHEQHTKGVWASSLTTDASCS